MRKRRKRKGFRLWHFIIMLVMFWLGKTLISQSIMMRELNLRKQQQLEEISRLEEEIRELEAEIKNKDSLEFVEKVAREELRLVKPREIIYIDINKQNKFFANPTR
ncbi:MAG TPA: septum formation initiator family protein [Tissierellia bacterium]|nr:septum formation initiator family protein [Tissierellia bacterium]